VSLKSRPTAALTQIWCIFWSTCADESPFEQIEFRAPIHLAFYELQLGDLFLCPEPSWRGLRHFLGS